MRTQFVGLIVSILSLSAAAAHASNIAIGSPYSLSPTNSPDNFTANMTFGGTVSVDGGAATLSMTQKLAGPGAEWDIWTLTTTSGGPIAGNLNGFWEITQGFVLSQNSYLDGVVEQWLYNGAPDTGVTTGAPFGTGFSANNSATGGPALYNNGGHSLLSAGAYNNWNQIYTSCYSCTVGAIGADYSRDNGLTWALEFTSQTPVPEPGDLAILAPALAGLAFILRHRSKSAGIF